MNDLSGIVSVNRHNACVPSEEQRKDGPAGLFEICFASVMNNYITYFKVNPQICNLLDCALYCHIYYSYFVCRGE